jgi:2-oxoglutarate dehydrogenase E1 component
LRNIVEYLKNCYASNVGIEFKYISDQKKVDFLTKEMEKNFLNPLSLEKRKRILEKLNEGVIFEKFLHTKYVGQKDFHWKEARPQSPHLMPSLILRPRMTCRK